MSDNKDTQSDDVEFSQDELEELKKQGIDDDELDELVKTVNDELSDNANAKDYDKEKETDKSEDKKIDIKNDEDKITNADKIKTNLKSNDEIETAVSNNKTNKKETHKTDDLKNSELKNNSSKTEKELDKIEQQQADIVRTLIAKKHGEKTINHKNVRISIEAGALPTKMFFIMNGLSAVIAGYGLLANSPAVVIGAMLVAMMLSPITSMALAVIDARLSLLKTSLQTLIGGILLIFAIGMVLGFLYPDHVMTGEILARTSPTTMDLVVALAGGTAGAYAMVSPNLSVAVVGVAVATALVPPLTASGILLSAGHFSLAMGALLLAITNMLAIQFTNALVLWLFGFRRTLNDDDVGKLGQLGQFLKRNFAVLMALVVIGGYLSFNFSHTLNEQNFERQSNALIEKSIEHQANYLVSSSINKEQKVHVLRAVIQGTEPPSQAQVYELEKAIQKIADDTFKNRTIKLQIRFVPETVIESTPSSESELKLSPDDIRNLQRMTNQ
ncbi:DUF389 domain-containing protein [Moraxella bovis]|uniref:DUF389 domain-containing protein n=1 Tax=Moraxella bovis TaxID=476 RepID=A0AAQ2Q6V7_MORBO|nr:DUF389 domain-containing protein [Moraxella bovis]AWY19997.1 DUF389 domain-containing protein [Moraxella bovis]UYZ74859.1 DUF389 domain-containing protein [Moraxella bovis]UYZ79213.1 DUF389 domain-containing protein [Moraxella bovis]UYZ80207.1 DUF389 domain-containing protein [Moraxella bovis]UYZ87693.1 DUF389 domain-containing protein [Moraxella bovis]